MTDEKTDPQQTTPNNDRGNEPQAKSPIEQANETVARLKAENDRREQLLKREEELAARRIVGGRAMTGEPKKEEEEEPTIDNIKKELSQSGW